MMFWDEAIISFYNKLRFPAVPASISILNPFQNDEAKKVWQTFYKKYYHDDAKRIMMIGINPGRFGAGVTGIPFTDPIRLSDICGITNTLDKKPELSSLFIYALAEKFGGADRFFQHCYFTSVSPLGFVRDGKNINYYDDQELQRAITPFAADCMQRQLSFPIIRKTAIVIGEGKNYSFLQKLNEQFGWFEKIVPLAHPRFVMQYKRRHMEEYIGNYIQAINKCF